MNMIVPQVDYQTYSRARNSFVANTALIFGQFFTSFFLRAVSALTEVLVQTFIHIGKGFELVSRLKIFIFIGSVWVFLYRDSAR